MKRRSLTCTGALVGFKLIFLQVSSIVLKLISDWFQRRRYFNWLQSFEEGWSPAPIDFREWLQTFYQQVKRKIRRTTENPQELSEFIEDSV